MEKRTPKQKFTTAATTFSVALGIGFVMQYGDAMASRWGADQPVAGPESYDISSETIVLPATSSVALPQSMFIPDTPKPETLVASSTFVPAEIETPVFEELASPAADAALEAIDAPVLAAATRDTPNDIADVLPEPMVETANCDPALSLTPAGFAMVTLSYDAPCAPNATVAVLHEEMLFEMVTDANGSLVVDVPALSEEALFGVEDADGEAVFAITGVPEIGMYDRVAVQWQGQGDVQLHALEFGATYGETGHVWAAATGDRVDAAAGSSGFMTQLGDGDAMIGHFADVYTFPSGLSTISGDIALSVEIEVTANNCNRAVKAQTMQVNPIGRPVTEYLSLNLPGCEAIGEFLVLNNLFEDLTLASR